MDELPARTVAVARRVFARTDAIHIDRPAEQRGVENQPTTGTLPKQPRVIHSRRNARSTDDEAEAAVIHLVGDPERLCLAVARPGRFRFRRSLWDERIFHVIAEAAAG